MVAILAVAAAACLAVFFISVSRRDPNPWLVGGALLATILLASAALGDGAKLGGSWGAHIGLGAFCLLMIAYAVGVLTVIVAGIARVIAARLAHAG